MALGSWPRMVSLDTPLAPVIEEPAVPSSLLGNCVVWVRSAGEKKALSWGREGGSQIQG